MGKWCLHAGSFIFDQVVIKVAGNQDRHKSSDEFDFGPLVSMAHLYVFEMRFDLGTLDSGERSLPFGLLVSFLLPCHVAPLSRRIIGSSAEYVLFLQTNWASSWDYGTYHIGGQRRLRRACAVSPEPSLFAHMKYGSRRRVRPKIRHLAPLNGCACAFTEWVYGGRKVP